jgi:CheY-like chemotaxis protein
MTTPFSQNPIGTAAAPGHSNQLPGQTPASSGRCLKTLNPTLLLLDLEMPNYNGFELCQTVRQDVQYRDLPILVITAHTDSISLQQAITAGADDVLPKPVSEDVLLDRISNLLAGRKKPKLECH